MEWLCCFRSTDFYHLSAAVLTVAEVCCQLLKNVNFLYSAPLSCHQSLVSVISVCGSSSPRFSASSTVTFLSFHTLTSFSFSISISSLFCLTLSALSHHFSSLSSSLSSPSPHFLFSPPSSSPRLASVFNLTLPLIFKLEIESATSLFSSALLCLSVCPLCVYSLRFNFLLQLQSFVLLENSSALLFVLDLCFCLSPGQLEQNSLQPAELQHQYKNLNMRTIRF